MYKVVQFQNTHSMEKVIEVPSKKNTYKIYYIHVYKVEQFQNTISLCTRTKYMFFSFQCFFSLYI